MRYSRIKKKRGRRKYAILILVIIFILATAYIFSAGTLGKYLSRFISPIIGGDILDTEDNSEDISSGDDEEPQLLISDKQNSGEEKTTDTIEAKGITLNTIQMNAFTGQGNANEFANEIKRQGGAGYIQEDDFFRVLAVGFLSNDDAMIVQEQLKNDGVDSKIYTISTSGVNMNVTASEENISSIKAAFDDLHEIYEKIEQIMKDLDLDKLSVNEAQDMIRTIKSDLDMEGEKLATLASSQTNNEILKRLTELYEDSSSNVTDIASGKYVEKVEISSEIKYTYIDLIIHYIDYIEQIIKIWGAVSVFNIIWSKKHTKCWGFSWE